MFNAEYAIIIMGTHNLSLNDSSVQRIFANQSNFIIHPKFNYHSASLDIAIVHVHQSIQFNDYVQPVTLPSNFLLEETYAGEIGTITGHGQYCAYDCNLSSVLRFSKNRVLSNDDCRALSPFHTFPSETQICISTSENGVGSSCRGDSGSALTVMRNNKALLIGISSFGNRKCDEGKPSIFTRLTREIVTWIWSVADN